ncbi:hypothetical protein HMI56_002459 [Coelomomyces lativittatus]|nr:hypothetical protein HMI56_002459 [Coelomomyces lativittatus]
MTSKIIMCDSSKNLLFRDQHLDHKKPIAIERVILNEETEFSQHFKSNSLDMVVSNLSMHWVNDLPGLLIQILQSLKPDGVFLGALLGGDTLFELRTSLQLAEQEREGGLSPRVSPMTLMPDMAGLLLRTGYTLSTVDMDEIIVEYPTPFDLIQDLRLMGESSAISARRPTLHRDTLISASAIYQMLYGDSLKGTVPATFQVIFMIGWKPSDSQPKPKPRGSAKQSLKTAIEEST